MTTSIHSRIIFSALVILILFMSLTGFVLDNAFRKNIEYSQQENLRTHIYTLLATAELNEDNGVSVLQLPEEVTEPRFNVYESDLYARILTVADKIVWQSKSMTNAALPFPTKIKMGEFSFSRKTLENNTYALINFTTIWVTSKGENAYVFQVAENINVLNHQIINFRKNLWSWLIGVSFMLIAIQILILRWGLKPLRIVAEDLLEIERGNQKKLSGTYPTEIKNLTKNINQLIDSSQQQLSRYRDALGNMAHTLKTPITVLQGIINATSSKDKNTAVEQLNTINNIVEYQLQRAATVGRIQFSDAIDLVPITKKILRTLKKVHSEKNIDVQLNTSEKTMVKIDQGDLYELLGNLLENAFKWCNKKISIAINDKNDKIQINIEDDGPGINDKEKERILLRGQRADQNTPGHGLGLAMVNDILLLYKGDMQITDSKMGGAKIIIKI